MSDKEYAERALRINAEQALIEIERRDFAKASHFLKLAQHLADRAAWANRPDAPQSTDAGTQEGAVD